MPQRRTVLPAQLGIWPLTAIASLLPAQEDRSLMVRTAGAHHSPSNLTQLAFHALPTVSLASPTHVYSVLLLILFLLELVSIALKTASIVSPDRFA